jgi:geranylgeranyl diphosphate synthase type II
MAGWSKLRHHTPLVSVRLKFLWHDGAVSSVGSSVPEFADYVRERRTEIEAALEQALPRPPACPALVSEAMRYSLDAGGKRVRPILALAAAEAVAQSPRGGDERARSTDAARRLAMPAACALEFIHTYSLVHDDLPAMDNDTLRRGRPTLHVVYGDGIAILAGDGLLTEAFGLLARGEPGELPAISARRLRVIARIGEAAGVIGMVGGQAIDLESTGTVQIPGRVATTLDAAGLADMHARKTGALIRAAAASGAIMAGGTDDAVDAVDRFAADLGLVFQIVDDILDVEGDSAALGKTAGKDAASGKLTYPALYGLERSRELAAEGIARAAQSLADADLSGGRLLDIAHWVISRSH